MGAHAPYAPSGAARWTVCTASVPLAASAEALGFPKSESEYARAGTVAMAVAEQYLRLLMERQEMLFESGGKIDLPPPTLARAAARAVELDAIDFTEWNPEEFEAPLTFFLAKAEDLVKHAKEWGTETRVHIHQVPTFGSCDFHALLLDDTLYVVDYKHGAGVEVTPEDNAQLLLYAAGLADKYGLEDDARLVLVVCQPRHPAGGWRQAEYNVRYAREYATWAGERIKTFEYVVGPHCQFCPAMLICGKRYQELEDVAGAEKIVGDLLARILDRSARVNEVIKQARNAAIAQLMAGKTIPGWRLTEGRGEYVWKPGAEQRAIEKFGEAAFTKPALLSPAQVRDSLPGGAEFFKENAVRRPGKPTLERGEAEARVINWPKEQTDD
jgi:hypothetical protein